MIIIAGMLLLLTIPVFIYARCKSDAVKKPIFIMCEIVAVAVLIFGSTLVVLDVPYIINGGLKCEADVVYTNSYKHGTTVKTADGKKYWASDGQQYGNPAWVTSLKAAEEGEVELYVLPHTHLIYKVKQVRSRLLEKIIEDGSYNSFIYPRPKRPPYDLYKMRELSFTDFGIFMVIAMLWYAIYKWLTE